MSGQPVEYQPPYDPAAILEALPPGPREHFRVLYETAVEAARRPENYQRLHELLHLWSLKAGVYSTDPGFDRSPEVILSELAADDGGAYLEDVLPEFGQRLFRRRAHHR
ncbi:DUF6247 family protein [Nonomuraea longicatena]